MPANRCRDGNDWALYLARLVQTLSGVGAFALLTLYKLVWLKENHPRLLEQAHCGCLSWQPPSRPASLRPISLWRAPASYWISSARLWSARKSCRRRAWRDAGSAYLVEVQGAPIGTLRTDAAGPHSPGGCAGDLPDTILGCVIRRLARSRWSVLSSGFMEILMVRGQVDTSLLSRYPGSTCETGRSVGALWRIRGWPPYSNGAKTAVDAGNAMANADRRSARYSAGAEGVRGAVRSARLPKYCRLAGRDAQYHPRPFLSRRAGSLTAQLLA